MSTTAQASRFCAGCMTAPNVSGTCANCRWSDDNHPETQTHLPRHYLLAGRYYIGRVLGQRGFGVTYLARDLKLERTVAVKEYLPATQCTRLLDRVTVLPHSENAELFQYGLQSFLNEARALAMLGDYPNIVSVTDFAETNGTVYLVMSYVDGISLKQYLDDHNNRIDYRTAIDILLPVLDALREMHSHGLLHRDISPGNIMITRKGQVKVVDFGAARYAIGEQSKSLSMIVKQGYAPEEQYRTRGKQGSWTDVYAVAATLYRCITGELPPTAPDRLAEDELIRPSVLCNDLPPAVEAAILKGLAVRASDRFQTVEEFQQALLQERSEQEQPDKKQETEGLPVREGQNSKPSDSKGEIKDDKIVSRPRRWGRIAASVVVFLVGLPVVLLAALPASWITHFGYELDRSAPAIHVFLFYTACARGDSGGCRAVGEFYRGRALNPLSWDPSSDPLHEDNARDFQRARSLLSKACSGGNSLACWDLGNMYALGQGMATDLETAAMLYRKTCSMGEKYGCESLQDVQAQMQSVANQKPGKR